MKILPKDSLTEIFKPLNYPNCEDRYCISNYGRVWDCKNGKFSSPNLTGDPAYYYVNLRNSNGKRLTRRVHNLLARTFIDKPEDTTTEVYNTVDHKDRNKYNNSIENLRWVTRRENSLNRDCTIMYKGLLFSEYCKVTYPEDTAAHSKIYQRCRIKGITLEESEDIYLRRLNGEDFTEITVNGIKIRRDDYLAIVGITLEELKYQRVNLTYEDIALGYKFKKPVSNKTIGVNSIEYENIWYPTIKVLCDKHNLNVDTVRRRTDRGMTLKEALEYKHIEEYTVTKDGKRVTGNVAELCRLFGKDKNNIRDDITLRGLTLQQALTKEPERVTKYRVDGEVIRKKALIQRHLPDVSPVKFNTKSRTIQKYSKIPDLTNIQILRMTFEHFDFYDLPENIEIGNT